MIAMARHTCSPRGAIAVTNLLLASLLVVLPSCKRERRDFSSSAPAELGGQPPLTTLHPGPAVTVPHTIMDSALTTMDTAGPYADNAYAISQGQQLFSQFNCSGCHSHGGGGMGPPLMDRQWIYGSAPSQIFTTIVRGRPNGMPSFRDKLTDGQVWELVAYVRALSGMGRKDARNDRRDAMQVRSSEENTQTPPPQQQGAP